MTELRLTVAQQGVWFAQQLDPSSAAFVTAECLELAGDIDDAALASAIRATIDEVDVLHARVVERDGELLQRLAAPADWPLAQLDLRDEPDGAAAAERWMARALEQPIDPACDRLFGEALLRVADDRVLWLQRVHHLAVDAVGLQLVARRAAERYGALLAGEEPGPSPFPALESVVAAERAYRDSPAAERDRRYWETEWSGGDPPVAALSDRPPGPVRGVRRASVALPAATLAALRDAANAAAASWPEVVIAACGAYVHRFAGPSDPEDPHAVVLGLPLSARLGPVALRAAVTTVNVLPLRADVGADTSAHALTRTVRGELRTIRRHQRHRGEDLRRAAGAIGLGRPLYGPLINVLPFDYALRFGPAPAAVRTLAAGPVDDVSFNVYDRGDQPARLDVEGNRDRHDDAAVSLHAERFAAFLATFAAAVSRGEDGPPVDALELLPESERELVLRGWNATEHPVDDVTLTDLLVAAAQEHADRPAVRFDGAELTFAELHARAQRLAERLAAHGAGPGSIVAVALPRSAELLVALVAVLRSGAAYLPLDLDYPPGRLAMMLEDATPVAAITTAGAGADAIAWPSGLPVLDVADEPADGAPERRAPAAAGPGDPAYVIFTSGSTGRPKGVVVSHRAIVNRLQWMQGEYRLGPGDRVIQKTPVGFDVSVWELFWPLVAGVPLVVAPPGLHRDPQALAQLVARESVTTIHFVPSMLALFVDEPAALRCRSLRRVICSGEALPAELTGRFLARMDCELHNLYGPTEAAVDVTHWACAVGDALARVPIGRPVWNTRVYVLDGARQPVPIGAVGELHLAGVQLAEGYLGRPDLTEAAFVADPFVPGERMYRTGDRARWRPDGALDFLGRLDHQMKIRGQRIETGEIEAALVGDPAIARAAVVARADGPGGAPRLVAYVVPADPAVVPEPATIRATLRRTLSEAMIPAAITALDALPLGATGKLDRAALPDPEPDPSAADAGAGRSPRTPQEELVCAIFAELLGVPLVAADDDFFLLGGDSLLAARAAARVRDALGAPVTIGTVFAAPTPAALAQRLEDGDHAALDVLLELRRGDDRPPLFCLHPAGGIGWCYTALARSLPPGQSVYALQARGLGSAAPLPASIDAMAVDYAAQIRAVQPEGPYRLLGWSVGGVIAHAIAVALQQEGNQVELLALLDAYPSDQWRDLAEPTEAQALVALLNIAGIGASAEDDDGAPLHRHGVIAALRAEGSALASLEDHTLTALVDIVVNNARLMREHVHERFDGDLLHIRAAAPRPETWLSAEGWQRHVGGRVEIRDVPCTHVEIVRSEALATIVPALTDRLERSSAPVATLDGQPA